VFWHICQSTSSLDIASLACGPGHEQLRQLDPSITRMGKGKNRRTYFVDPLLLPRVQEVCLPDRHATIASVSRSACLGEGMGYEPALTSY
jgi:hypothetical protein